MLGSSGTLVMIALSLGKSSTAVGFCFRIISVIRKKAKSTQVSWQGEEDKSLQSTLTDQSSVTTKMRNSPYQRNTGQTSQPVFGGT